MTDHERVDALQLKLKDKIAGSWNVHLMIQEAFDEIRQDQAEKDANEIEALKAHIRGLESEAKS